MTALAPSPTRSLLVWVLTTTVAAAAVWWTLPDLDAAARALREGGAGGQPFDRWLAWLCAATLAGCAVWCWYVVTVVVAQTVGGRPSPRADTRTGTRTGVPGWARRLVLAACGAAVVGGALAPGAHAGDSSHRWLDGLPLPERAEGRSVAEVVAARLLHQPTAPTARPVRAPAAATTHVVRPGESLWSIAAASLAADGAAPSEAQVAAYWPRVHQANRDAVPDPDVIRPGQDLVLPPPPDQPSELGEDNR